jgi:hypothetical protein
MDAHFGLFGNSANIDARSVHGLHRMYHRLRNHFRRSRCNFLVTWVMWNLILVHLQTMLVSAQDSARFVPNEP